MDKPFRNAFHRKAGYAVVPLAGYLILSACSFLPKGELPLDLGIKDRGVASWYGKEFHGKLAANGEVFDMTAYTAAHRKLPLGSIVRVINLENGKVCSSSNQRSRPLRDRPNVGSISCSSS